MLKQRLLVPMLLSVGVVFLFVDNYVRVGVWFQLCDVWHHETLIVVFVLLSFVSYFRSVEDPIKIESLEK